ESRCTRQISLFFYGRRENERRPVGRRESSLYLMGDPRNVAHAKKVTQEKHHKGDAAHSHQPRKKAQPARKNQAVAEQSSAAKTAEIDKPEQKPDAAKLEKSLPVLAKLKELESHSRSNIEKL